MYTSCSNLSVEEIPLGRLSIGLSIFALIALVCSITAQPRVPRIAQPKTILENEFVRVSQIDSVPPRSAIFDTPEFQEIALWLVDSSSESVSKGTSRTNGPFDFGSVEFLTHKIETKLEPPGGRHPLRLVYIDLKAIPPLTPFEKDAVRLDAGHNKVLFENDRVRIVRLQFPLGEKGPIVDKRARVIILLNDMHAEVAKPGGAPEPRDGTAGTIYWSLGGSQATMNRNETKLDNIVVELKGK
jgi:hypothetical protein